MTDANSSTHRDVQWPKDTFGTAQPAWSSEPDLSLLERIARQHLPESEDIYAISLFAQGGFNKIYAVDTPGKGKTYLIRVALPVEPRLKTLSEVATIEYVRAHACAAVPRILAYEADAEASGLGYEWMLLEKIDGDVLEARWRDMEWDAKVELVKSVAGVLGKFYDRPLSGIGNIYPDAPDPGRIVSMQFFWDEHYEQDVPRGPFSSSHDWLRSCLQFVLNDTAAILARPVVEDDSDDEGEREEALETRSLAERLVQLLPRIFPPSSPDDEPERTIIHHDDISFHNLLVSPTGELTGIIDWECVSAFPLWRACTFPSFLESRARVECPDVEKYGKDEDDESRPNELYYEHLREWECTRLRGVFLDELESVQPQWIRMHREKASALKNDFYWAMRQCDEEFSRRKIGEWLDMVEAMSDEDLEKGVLGEGYVSLDESFVN
ncbi:unnamed protein product [Peniophora sp. CBMAI 1063]|nr:unnamed protein product [Peniophora sp. CBMAI 1063]